MFKKLFNEIRADLKAMNAETDATVARIEARQVIENGKIVTIPNAVFLNATLVN
jgi:hypothetical protein